MTAIGTEHLDARFRRRVTGLATAAAVGGFLFGFDSSVVNGAVDSIGTKMVQPNVPEGAVAYVQGFVVAIALLGCAVGAWVAGRLADHWGRPRVMLLGAGLFLISAIGSTLAQTMYDLSAWRLVGGLGIGIASVIAPAYISEIAPKAVRGGLASLQQLAITVGILVALLSDAGFKQLSGPTPAGIGSNHLPHDPLAAAFLGMAGWRWMFLVAVIPAVVYGVLALRVPESPRYLLMIGKRPEAEEIISTIVPAGEVEGVIADAQLAIAEDRASAKASLRGPSFGLHPIVWVGILLSVFQQFVGINIVFYYSNTLWTAVGLGAQASLLSILGGVLNVLVTFIAIGLVDRIGRKLLLLIGSVGMAVPLALEAVAFGHATLTHNANGSVTPHLSTGWAVLAVVAANVFIIAFGASWGPLVWVLLGEIFPTRIRARALGVAAAAQWIANFIITESFLPLSKWSLSGTYVIYAIFAVLSFIFVLARVPETKGVALEKTEELFTKRHERNRRSKNPPASASTS